MLPCIEDKCLKFPICKTQRSIFCTPLYDYIYCKVEYQSEAYSILLELVDCYRDYEKYKGATARDYMDGAPIINASRLMEGD